MIVVHRAGGFRFVIYTSDHEPAHVHVIGDGHAKINLVGPDTLTGVDAAAVWSEVLGRAITYGGDDTGAFEQNLRQFMPSWMAFDMRLMSERFLTEGMIPDTGDVERLTSLLGRPLRSYRDFASEIATSP